MKKSFPGYYSPTSQELKVLWSKGVFVFDTNVLLHLYRVPKAARNQMISVLTALKGRVWIPRHVGIEYQRRRLDEVSTAHNSTGRILKDIDKALVAYEGAVEAANLKERGVVEADEPLEKIKEMASKIKGIVEASLAGQLKVTDHDVIRDAIDDIFVDRVGPAPVDQDEIDAWNALGKDRFSKKRGPGYEDAEKAESKEPEFFAQGLVYQRQYGDLYIWFQLLDHVRKEGIKNVVFVTQDGKPDWWRQAPGSGQGRDRARLAPLEALTEEMMGAGADQFWMYQLDTFLQEAERQLKVKVSDLTIKDARTAEAAPTKELEVLESARLPRHGSRLLRHAMALLRAHTVEQNEKFAVGYRNVTPTDEEGLIVVSVPAAREGGAEFRKELKNSIELLDLFIGLDRIQVYVISRSTIVTGVQRTAVTAMQKMMKSIVPNLQIKVDIARFGGKDGSSLIVNP